MFNNNLKIVLRRFLNSKTLSIINVAGLALGLACCITVYLFVRSESGYDSYHENKENVYRLTLDVAALSGTNRWKGATSSILWAPALKNDYPEVTEFARVMPDNDEQTFRVAGNEFNGISSVFADKSVFTLFTWPLLDGEPATALADVNSVVISESVAKRFFGEESAVGQTIEADYQMQMPGSSGEPRSVALPFKVTGVMRRWDTGWLLPGWKTLPIGFIWARAFFSFRQ